MKNYFPLAALSMLLLWGCGSPKESAVPLETPRAEAEAERPATTEANPTQESQSSEQREPELGAPVEKAQESPSGGQGEPEPEAPVEKAPPPTAVNDEPQVEQTTTVDLPMREWVALTGHQIKAAFVAVEDGHVRLKKEDGKIVSVPIEKLGEADRKWVSLKFFIEDGETEPFKWPDDVLPQRKLKVTRVSAEADAKAVVATQLLYKLDDGSIVVTQMVFKSYVLATSKDGYATFLFPSPGTFYYGELKQHLGDGSVEADIWLVPEGTTEADLSEAEKMSNVLTLKVSR